MDALAEKLDSKLQKWKPATAEKVRDVVSEIMDLADNDTLDISRSREVEQDVLNLLDAPTTR